MSDTNVIKSIVNQNCPHCNKEIFIESQMMPPAVISLFTPETMEAAKKDCLMRVETLTISEEKKAAVRKWLADPNTVFGPTVVESIMLSLLKPE